MMRKLPALTPDSRHFWQGGANGQLLMHFCTPCQRYFHPPGPLCPQCSSNRVAPQAVTGSGTIISFTINYQPWSPDLRVPYVIAIIELDAQPGLRLLSNIINCDPLSVAINQRVQVRFEPCEDIWLPLFERLPEPVSSDSLSSEPLPSDPQPSESQPEVHP
jgi:uncharacterized OB-fold protein